MKEQMLLHAIQNADRQFYEEAEQRIHHRKEISMKHNGMIRILCGTAAAAVFGVTAFCGWKQFRSRQLAHTVPETAASQPAAPVQGSNGANFLGGHGELHFSAGNGNILYDDDNWYFTPFYAGAKNTDAASVTLSKTAPADSRELLGEKEQFLIDRFGGGIYCLDTETGVIYSIAADGTRSPLNTAEYRKAQTGAQADYRTNATVFARLTDTKYFIEGYYLTGENDPQPDQHIRSFWQIFDTETGKAAEGTQELICYDWIYSDGDAGIYAVAETGEGENTHYAVAHITESGAETVFDEYARSCGWYLYGDCIYYGIPKGNIDPAGENDFYRYNLKTGEKTVLLENCCFDILVTDGDRVYAQVEAEEDRNNVHIVSFKPDLTDRKEWTFSIAGSTADREGFCYLTDVCGGCLIFDTPGKAPNDQLSLPVSGNNSTDYAEVCNPNFLVYHLDTGAVQSFSLN